MKNNLLRPNKKTYKSIEVHIGNSCLIISLFIKTCVYKTGKKNLLLKNFQLCITKTDSSASLSETGENVNLFVSTSLFDSR